MMIQLIDKSALVAEIERKKSVQLSIFSKGVNEKDCYDSLTCISVYNEILSFINTLSEEPVSELWHDSNKEQPKAESDVAIWDGERGHVKRCTEYQIVPTYEWHIRIVSACGLHDGTCAINFLHQTPVIEI